MKPPFIATFLVTALSVLVSGCAYYEITGAGEDYHEVRRIWEYCEKCLAQEGCAERSECKKNTPEKIESVMETAVSEGRLDTVRYLIEVIGFDVNARMGRYRTTALHKCSYYGGPQDHEICHYLVSKGADINAVNTTNARTPLLTSIWKHNNTNARFLLSKGADPSIPNARGQDACVYARVGSNWDIMPELPNCCEFYLGSRYWESTPLELPELFDVCKKKEVLRN
jgi:hypothetical protein